MREAMKLAQIAKEADESGCPRSSCHARNSAEHEKGVIELPILEYREEDYSCTATGERNDEEIIRNPARPERIPFLDSRAFLSNVFGRFLGWETANLCSFIDADLGEKLAFSVWRCRKVQDDIRRKCGREQLHLSDFWAPSHERVIDLAKRGRLIPPLPEREGKFVSFRAAAAADGCTAGSVPLPGSYQSLTPCPAEKRSVDVETKKKGTKEEQAALRLQRQLEEEEAEQEAARLRGKKKKKNKKVEAAGAGPRSSSPPSSSLPLLPEVDEASETKSVGCDFQSAAVVVPSNGGTSRADLNSVAPPEARAAQMTRTQKYVQLFSSKLRESFGMDVYELVKEGQLEMLEDLWRQLAVKLPAGADDKAGKKNKKKHKGAPKKSLSGGASSTSSGGDASANCPAEGEGGNVEYIDFDTGFRVQTNKRTRKKLAAAAASSGAGGEPSKEGEADAAAEQDAGADAFINFKLPSSVNPKDEASMTNFLAQHSYSGAYAYDQPWLPGGATVGIIAAAEEQEQAESAVPHPANSSSGKKGKNARKKPTALELYAMNSTSKKINASTPTQDSNSTAASPSAPDTLDTPTSTTCLSQPNLFWRGFAVNPNKRAKQMCRFFCGRNPDATGESLLECLSSSSVVSTPYIHDVQNCELAHTPEEMEPQAPAAIEQRKRYVWQKCGILENSDADLAYKKLSLPERNFLLGEGKGTEALIEQLEHASIKSKAGVLFSKIKMVMQNRRWNQENDNPMFEPNRKLFLELHKLDADATRNFLECSKVNQIVLMREAAALQGSEKPSKCFMGMWKKLVCDQGNADKHGEWAQKARNELHNINLRANFLRDNPDAKELPRTGKAYVEYWEKKYMGKREMGMNLQTPSNGLNFASCKVKNDTKSTTDPASPEDLNAIASEQEHPSSSSLADSRRRDDKGNIGNVKRTQNNQSAWTVPLVESKAMKAGKSACQETSTTTQVFREKKSASPMLATSPVLATVASAPQSQQKTYFGAAPPALEVEGTATGASAASSSYKKARPSEAPPVPMPQTSPPSPPRRARILIPPVVSSGPLPSGTDRPLPPSTAPPQPSSHLFDSPDEYDLINAGPSLIESLLAKEGMTLSNCSSPADDDGILSQTEGGLELDDDVGGSWVKKEGESEDRERLLAGRGNRSKQETVRISPGSGASDAASSDAGLAAVWGHEQIFSAPTEAAVKEVIAKQASRATTSSSSCAASVEKAASKSKSKSSTPCARLEQKKPLEENSDQAFGKTAADIKAATTSSTTSRHRNSSSSSTASKKKAASRSRREEKSILHLLKQASKNGNEDDSENDEDGSNDQLNSTADAAAAKSVSPPPGLGSSHSPVLPRRTTTALNGKAVPFSPGNPDARYAGQALQKYPHSSHSNLTPSSVSHFSGGGAGAGDSSGSCRHAGTAGVLAGKTTASSRPFDGGKQQTVTNDQGRGSVAHQAALVAPPGRSFAPTAPDHFGYGKGGKMFSKEEIARLEAEHHAHWLQHDYTTSTGDADDYATSTGGSCAAAGGAGARLAMHESPAHDNLRRKQDATNSTKTPSDDCRCHPADGTPSAGACTTPDHDNAHPLPLVASAENSRSSTFGIACSDLTTHLHASPDMITGSVAAGDRGGRHYLQRFDDPHDFLFFGDADEGVRQDENMPAKYSTASRELRRPRKAQLQGFIFRQLLRQLHTGTQYMGAWRSTTTNKRRPRRDTLTQPTPQLAWRPLPQPTTGPAPAGFHYLWSPAIGGYSLVPITPNNAAGGSGGATGSSPAVDQATSSPAVEHKNVMTASPGRLMPVDPKLISMVESGVITHEEMENILAKRAAEHPASGGMTEEEGATGGPGAVAATVAGAPGGGLQSLTVGKHGKGGGKHGKYAAAVDQFGNLIQLQQHNYNAYSGKKAAGAAYPFPYAASQQLYQYAGPPFGSSPGQHLNHALGAGAGSGATSKGGYYNNQKAGLHQQPYTGGAVANIKGARMAQLYGTKGAAASTAQDGRMQTVVRAGADLSKSGVMHIPRCAPWPSLPAPADQAEGTSRGRREGIVAAPSSASSYLRQLLSEAGSSGPGVEDARPAIDRTDAGLTPTTAPPHQTDNGVRGTSSSRSPPLLLSKELCPPLLQGKTVSRVANGNYDGIDPPARSKKDPMFKDPGYLILDRGETVKVATETEVLVEGDHHQASIYVYGEVISSSVPQRAGSRGWLPLHLVETAADRDARMRRAETEN
eukprot:g7592.t1